jgi:hypothetical protein
MCGADEMTPITSPLSPLNVGPISMAKPMVFLGFNPQVLGYGVHL